MGEKLYAHTESASKAPRQLTGVELVHIASTNTICTSPSPHTALRHSSTELESLGSFRISVQLISARLKRERVTSSISSKALTTYMQKQCTSQSAFA
jgi:hypothetical protein